ncbi:hypothetical protein BJD99_01015 [Rhodococcus sp. 1163]|uniref:phage tail tape measure protein n=1 Tax=Rhodococcus sp. 1163 TaxID=1905289 RepID=UPI000A02E179|nr:phage tail tape measure protein [Rhodococcus sp. 1163]ORI11752.1 hypothetical protein BJD99_01015 [Rhodococcus sp. 1163]
MALDTGTIYTRLELDDTRFTQGLATAERNARGLSTQFDRTSQSVRNSLRDPTTQLDRLGTNARNAGQDVRRLDEVPSGLGSSARRAAEEVDGISGAAERAAGGLSSLGGGLSERAGSSMGGGILTGLSSKLGDLGSKGGPIAGALAGVAVIGLAAGAVLADAIADGMQQQAVLDKVQAQLDIPQDVARSIGAAAGNSYSAGWGESVEANVDGIRAAIQAGLVPRDADTGAFQSTIDQLNIVSDLMGEEVPKVAQAAGQAVKNGLAANATEAMDILYQGQVNNLNVSEDLADSFVEYSTQLRALGLEGAEGWALVSQGANNGARDTDVVIDALKELKLRAADGTAAAAEGFDKLGVSAEDYRSAMVRGDESSRDMMATVLRNLQQIQDPQDKYNASLALYGTKFEDIQAAADHMNLDTAMAQFGQVEGSVKKAGDTMAQSGAASFESAARSIETSADDIKLALADAFGPELANLADWVTANKGELIGLFTALATGALDCGIALAQFSADTLRVMANLSEGTGRALGFIVGGMGEVVSLAGSLASALGMDDVASKLQGVGEAMQGFQQSTAAGADTMRGMADTIDGSIPGLQNLRNGVFNAGTEAANSTRLMQALGDAVITDVPDSKTIMVSDNSPETIERLRNLGLKVEQTPNGIRVTAETVEAETIIADFLARERRMTVVVDTARTAQAERDFRRTGGDMPMQGPVAPVFATPSGSNPATGGFGGGGGSFADGGAIRGAGGPRDDVIPLWGSNGEHMLDAGDVSKLGGQAGVYRFRAALDRGDVGAFADGGAIGDKDAALSYASSKNGMAYEYGKLDCSGYWSGIYNAYTGKDVRFTTDSDFAALGFVPGYDDGGFNIGTNGGSGMNGHMAGDLFGTPAESGSDGIVFGAGAQSAQDFPMVWHLPRGDDGSENLGSGTAGGATAAGGDTTGAGAAGSATGGDVRNVYVTNWPASLASAASGSAPTASGGSGGGSPQGGGTAGQLGGILGDLAAAATSFADSEPTGLASLANGAYTPKLRTFLGGVEEDDPMLRSFLGQPIAPTDTVPAMLEPGEMVIPKDIVDQHGGLLDMIRRNAVGSYADGGTVGFFGPSDRSYESGGSKHAESVHSWAAAQSDSDAVGSGKPLTVLRNASKEDVANENLYRGIVGGIGAVSAISDLAESLLGGGIIGLTKDSIEQLASALAEKNAELVAQLPTGDTIDTQIQGDVVQGGGSDPSSIISDAFKRFSVY